MGLTEKQRDVLAGFMIALGLALIGVLTGEPYLTGRVPEEDPHPVFLGFAVVGTILVVAGVLLWILLRIKLPSLGRFIECYQAKRSELESIRAIALEHFQDSEISTLDRMRTWYNRNPRVFWVLVRARRNKENSSKKIIGYFCLLPLTYEAAARVREGQLNGSNIVPGDIVEGGKSCAAVYLGAVAASGIRARGTALSHLHSHATNYWRKRSPVFYTRPITAAGLRVARKYGFTPVVGAEGGIGDLFELPTDSIDS